MRMNNFKLSGFTMIELLLGMSVMATLLVSGLVVFYKILGGGNKTSIYMSLDGESRMVISAIKEILKYSKATAMGSNDRQDCLSAGASGLSDDSIVIESIKDGVSSTLQLSGDYIASVSATTKNINSDTIAIERVDPATPVFLWKCETGVADTVEVNFKATAAGVSGQTSVSENYKAVVVLRNTGIY